jgi:hypothetical protein
MSVKAGGKQTFDGLHGVISQKIELFITTAVRTSNPTQGSSIGRVLIVPLEDSRS